MKIKDTEVDDLLKGLADYKPHAEPDWDSFYSQFRNDIYENAAVAGKKTGGRIALSAGWRSAIIAIVALTGIVAVYVFTFDSASSDSPVENQTINAPIQTNEPPSLPNTTIVPDNSSGESGDKISNSTGLPENIILDNTGSGADIGNSLNTSNKTMLFLDEATVNKGLESPTGENEITLKPGDSLSEQPVLIKKTVIITDTVRITRPHKK